MLELVRKYILRRSMSNQYKYVVWYLAIPLVIGLIFVSSLYGKQSPQKAEEGVRLSFTSPSGQSRASAQKSERDAHTSKYIDLLMATDDAQVRREIRSEIALLKPAHETVKLLVDRYLATTSEEERTQLLSVIGQIDPTGSIDAIFTIASEVEDASLFVSLVYCLGEANDKESKLALLNLIKENLLVLEKKDEGLSAIARILVDNVEIADSPLLLEFLDSSMPTDAQIGIVVAIASEHPSLEMEQVLKTTSEIENSPELKGLIQRQLKSMKLKLDTKASDPSKAKLRERPPPEQ